MANMDAADVSKALTSDRDDIATDKALPVVRGSSNRAPSANDENGFDDDELLQRAVERIRDWKAAADRPSLLQVQTLFHELICDGASHMLRDKVADAFVDEFGKELGGKRALTSTWTQIAKAHAAQRAQAVRELGAKIEQQPLTAEQKTTMRDALPDLPRGYQSCFRPADQSAGEGRQQRREILHDVAHFRFDRFRFRELPDKQQRAVLGI